MKELNFPLLTKDQIEVRVGQVSAKGCALLLYKTARTDAEILDNIVGQGNWQKKFYTLQGVGMGDKERSIVVCSVGIYDEDKNTWVWKDDSGAESQVEQDKGVCSDAFKRAAGGSCWGIGRELYYTGFLFAKVPTKKKESGKGYELVDEYTRFEVKEIVWNEKPLALKTLVIVDNNGNVVLSKGSKEKVTQTSQNTLKPSTGETMYEDSQPITPKEEEQINKFQDYSLAKGSITAHDKAVLQAYLETADSVAQNKFFTYIDKNYNTMSIDSLSEIQGMQLVEMLNAQKKK